MPRTLRYILTALLIAAIADCAVLIARDVIEKRHARTTYDDAASTYTEPITAAESPTSDLSSPAALSSTDSVQPPITVDFEALRTAAPDVVGWIWCEGTQIDYPIVQGADDAFYLTHDYLGRRSSSGSIMMSSLASPDFSDPNTVIYGHRMKDGSMFADLADWFTPGFAGEHPCFWILTPDGAYRADIFAAYETYELSETYTRFLTRGDAFRRYLDAAASQSVFETDAELDTTSSYIVLSTCKHASGTTRLVIHAKLVPVGE